MRSTLFAFTLLKALFRLFLSCMQNISDYIQMRRLALAQRYIRETQLPFDTIYEVSGYGSITSMYRAFKKYLGTTPGQYREDAAAKRHK